MAKPKKRINKPSKAELSLRKRMKKAGIKIPKNVKRKKKK